MNLLQNNSDYKTWLGQLKSKFRSTQLKAAITVNHEMLHFYWELGTDIVEKQIGTQWGDGFLAQLSADLMTEFPDVKGFSRRNLEQIRQWVRFWADPQSIAKQPVSQLTAIPWGHNLAILKKCKNPAEAIYYVKNTLVHGWSRSVLVHQIESGLFQREGKAITNFSENLPPTQSELANQTLKDPYVFDFLSMTKNYTERDLEKGLIEHITRFLLELGSGFAYMGRQIRLEVGEKEYFLDLLFYHTHLHCHVVVELKTVEFEPEHAGKLNFYIKAIDEKMRREGDGPTIGILLCKERDKLVAEYALSDIHKPIGISEYLLTHVLPKSLKSSLPSIEEIEAELSQDLGGADQP